MQKRQVRTSIGKQANNHRQQAQRLDGKVAQTFSHFKPRRHAENGQPGTLDRA